MAELNTLSLAEMRDGLRQKKFSAVELAKAHNAAIEKAKTLNAYMVATPDIALKQAEEADKRIASGSANLLEGVPVAVKDLFATKDVLTTAGSRILEGFKPPYESTVTAKCWQAGGVMVGKTNMDEFAMGSSTTSSCYGPTKNPWRKDKDLVPGGSSGGSSAAVAADLAPFALGTDTGGSIRQPASFCGIVGIKPTYGRCSRWGIVAFASSLDQAGVFTRTVTDAAIALKAICGHDPKDSTSSPLAVPDFEKAVNAGVKGKKVGIPKEYRVEGTAPEILALWDKGIALLKEAGADVVEVSLPHTKYALPTYYIIAPAEASSNLARYDGVRYGLRVAEKGDSLDAMYMKTRAAGFGDEVKRRILIGTYVLSAGYYDAYYKKAQRVRYLIAQDFKKAFEKADVLLTPATPTAAFPIGAHEADPVTMYLNDVFTVPASLAGLPGMVIPGTLNADGLPLGLQLIGKAFDEESVFAAARALEERLAFNAKPKAFW